MVDEVVDLTADEPKEPLIKNMGLIQEVLEELYAMDDKPGLSEHITKWEGLEQDLKDWEDVHGEEDDN